MKRLALVLMLAGCGSEREIDVKGGEASPIQETPTDIDPGSPTLSFQDVTPILKTYCQPCHSSDAFLKSSTGWFDSAAPTRVKNLSMPPPASAQAKNLSAADRQKLLNFK